MRAAVRALLFKPIDADAAAWAAAVVVNGGSVSTSRKNLVSNLISAMKAAGSWALMDDAWLLVSESSTQALTSLKQRRLATAVNSPDFTANLGFTFDGATNYIDTGFIPSTHAVAMTATNARPSVYLRTNVTGTGSAMGVDQASGKRIAVLPQSSSAVAFVHSNATGSGPSFTLPASDSRGLTSGSRNGPDGTSVVAFKNGAALSKLADAVAYGATLPTLSIFIGGRNAAGAVATPIAAAIGWASVGASLTAAQELAEYNAIQAYMAACGAAV